MDTAHEAIQPQTDASSPPSPEKTSKNIFIIVAIIGFILILVVMVLILLSKRTKGQPTSAQYIRLSPTTKPVEPGISLKEEYANPFKKESQYTNPFSETQNPFDLLNE